jgi:hypothetical protein
MEIPIACPKCNHTTRIKARDATPGTEIKCPCGTVFQLTTDDLHKAQRALDDLQRTARRFGNSS